MTMSNELVSQFADLFKNKDDQNKRNEIYGTIVVKGGKKYVRMDGSDIETPIIEAMDCVHGDQVLVSLSNHNATVIGNITRPATYRDAGNISTSLGSGVAIGDISHNTFEGTYIVYNVNGFIFVADSKKLFEIHRDDTSIFHVIFPLNGGDRFDMLLKGDGQTVSILPYKNLTPASVELGDINFELENIYVQNPPMTVIDLDKVYNISDLSDQEAIDFIMELKPKKYKIVNGNTNKIHHGFDPREVETAVSNLLPLSSDFAGFVKSQKKEITSQNGDIEETVVDGEYKYGIGYEDFISDIIKVLQFNYLENQNLKNILGGAPSSSFDLYSMLDSTVSPVMKRNIWRGKNLGSEVTEEQYDEIVAGTFKGLFLGDYWEIDNVTWRIMDFDYWYGTGDQTCLKHHIVIMPDDRLYYHPMNDTATTNGAYVGSKMRSTGLNQAKTIINSAFGEDHILNHREVLQNATLNGYATGTVWIGTSIEIPDEMMIFGSYIWSPGGNGSITPSRMSTSYSQLAGLRINSLLICMYRHEYWTRNVVLSNCFSMVSGTRVAYFNYSNMNYGVRPVFGLVKEN